MRIHAIPEASPGRVEPRTWNLVVVFGLASCVQPATNDEGQSTTSTTSSSGTESTTDTESGSTGDGDGDGDGDGEGDCSNGGGCPPYYNCIDGECVPLDCISDLGCELFQECEDFQCATIGEPPPNCDFRLLDIPTEIQLGEPALALSFVDLDDDGRDHLVVATETDLRIYEFGVADPTIVPRDTSSLVIKTMVAGHFDDQPGEDLLLLVDSEFHRYFSDGATLGNPSFEPAPSPNTMNVAAGDFDGQPPTDLLTWGWSGTALHVGDMTLSLNNQVTEGAAFFPFGSSNPGIAITTESDFFDGNVAIFNLMGNIVAQQSDVRIYGEPLAIESPDAAAYMGVKKTYVGGFWSRLHRLDPNSGALISTTLIGDGPKLATADLDGDLVPEVVGGGGLTTIVFDPLGDPCLVDVDVGFGDYTARELAVGDHDGDGDEEVAIRLSSGAPSGDGDGDGDASDFPGEAVFIIDGE